MSAAIEMSRIVRIAPEAKRRFALAYYALYACNSSGHSSDTKFMDLFRTPFDTAFVRALSREVPDRVDAPDGSYSGVDGDRILAEQEGIRISIPKSDVVGRPSTRGHRVRYTVPAIAPWIMPGFVLRFGTRHDRTAPFSRIYVNIGAESATWALGDLSRQLERTGVNFAVKVLAHPRAYARCDACVVYIASEEIADAFRCLCEALSTSTTTVDAGTPLFTMPLAPGIGFADDPSDDGWGRTSHGEWVSKMFFEAATRSNDAYKIAESVVLAIERTGRDPQNPWLRPGRITSDIPVESRCL